MRSILTCLLLFSVPVWSACGSSSEANADAGGHDGSADSTDGGVTADAGDTPGGSCVEATVSSWDIALIDDVSVLFRARISPLIGGRAFDLYLETRNYTDAPLEGEFVLGTGREENYGTCARCLIAFYGTGMTRGYFARSGTIVLGERPLLTLDMVLDDVELGEVTIDPTDLTSTPVPDGDCIHIAHAEVQRVYSPPGWTCDAAKFDDGAECDCQCGILDWDCLDTDLPILGCNAGQLCMPTGPVSGLYSGDSLCVNDCERDTASRCPGTEVCIESPYGDLCISTESQIDRVAQLGGTCRSGSTLYCAIDGNGFNQGFCDLFVQGDRRCRPGCRRDSDCNTAGDERCYVFNSDRSSGQEVPIGYCAVPYPPTWTCGVDRWRDGTTCDCGCGAQDPDCNTGRDGVPVRGCDPGEVCNHLAQCAAP